jgi:hypothetical protein
LFHNEPSAAAAAAALHCCSNFCFEEHQSPVARRNTLVLFARNKNNMKRATIKFYTPRSPGYAAGVLPVTMFLLHVTRMLLVYDNMKRATIKFYMPRSPGYAAGASLCCRYLDNDMLVV